MFGLIASGRMVSTNFEPIGDKAFVIEIPNADEINHIVVFMTGLSRFPEGFAGLIFFSWPQTEANPKWQLLGCIGNEKPSVVFQITGLKKRFDDQMPIHQFHAPPTIPTTARIGISFESLSMVQQQMAVLEAEKNNASAQVADFSQRMLENFVNYAGSFAITQAQMVPNPSENYIPLSVVRNWYDNFLRKLSHKPNFWKL